jgi:hypothetical protein
MPDYNGCLGANHWSSGRRRHRYAKRLGRDTSPNQRSLTSAFHPKPILRASFHPNELAEKAQPEQEGYAG